MLTQLSAAELGRAIASKAVSCEEAANAYLSRIAAYDSSFGCYLAIDPETTLEQARKAQRLVDAGDVGPLTGVPIALKDNLSTDGIETTCGSKILAGFVPPFNATAVEKAERAGMVVLGKTNMDEFAMGTSTETSAYKVTRNPWNPSCSPGGSSGGSAAAVSAELAPVALGSDTGGSIRQPAALCGIVGFKPTFGRCSRYGLIAFGSSLDQVGPLARTVEDVALLAETITGHDPLDSTSLPHPPVSAESVKSGSLRGIKLAIPAEMIGASTDSGVRAAFDEAVSELQRHGAEIRIISLPSVDLGVTTYYIIAPAEASSNLARFDGIRFGPCLEGKGHIGRVARTRGQLFGHEVKARIMIGAYALSAGYYDAYYLRAQQVRKLMQIELLKAFVDVDFIVSPTSPAPAFKLGNLMGDPMALKLLDRCTIPANLGGMPAISLNCGFTEGLPVGFQMMAAPMQDEKLLQTAYCVEQALSIATRRPPIP